MLPAVCVSLNAATVLFIDSYMNKLDSRLTSPRIPRPVSDFLRKLLIISVKSDRTCPYRAHMTNVNTCMQLTDDICEQEGEGESQERRRQGCTLPVAAAVGLVEGEQGSGHAAPGERPRRRGVHGPRRQGVTLTRPRQ